MSSINTGSRVRQHKASEFYYQSEEKLGTVTGASSGNWWYVKWDDSDYKNVYRESQLIVVGNSKRTNMKKISTMMKKLIDSDTQKLVKAGFINGDLELTEEGRSELLALQFEQSKAALVAAAQAKIDEEKE